MKHLTDATRGPIRDFEEAKAFVQALIDEDLMWHFDDDPTDCLSGVVSHDDAVLLGVQRDRLYDFDWGQHECPIGYALYVMKKEEEK
jgi:hypothetical protein